MADQPATPSPVKVTWLIGTLVAFVIFAFIAGYSQQMAYLYKDYSQQQAETRLKTLAKLQADENKELNTLDWIDQKNKTIRIPIDRAEDVEIATLLLKPAAMGAAIPVTAPAAPASTNAAPVNATASSTNAAPAKPVAPGAKATSTNAAPAKPKAPAQPKQ